MLGGNGTGGSRGNESDNQDGCDDEGIKPKHRYHGKQSEPACPSPPRSDGRKLSQSEAYPVNGGLSICCLEPAGSFIVPPPTGTPPGWSEVGLPK